MFHQQLVDDGFSPDSCGGNIRIIKLSFIIKGLVYYVDVAIYVGRILRQLLKGLLYIQRKCCSHKNTYSKKTRFTSSPYLIKKATKLIKKSIRIKSFSGIWYAGYFYCMYLYSQLPSNKTNHSIRKSPKIRLLSDCQTLCQSVYKNW